MYLINTFIYGYYITRYILSKYIMVSDQQNVKCKTTCMGT